MKWWIPLDPAYLICPQTSAEVTLSIVGNWMLENGVDVSFEQRPKDAEERVFFGKFNPVATALEAYSRLPLHRAYKRVFLAGATTQTSLVSYPKGEFKAFLNEMDLIVCPSDRSRAIISQLDVRRPIVVLPQPVGEHFRYIKRSRMPREFLTIGMPTLRKGIFLLATIFEIWKKGRLTVLAPWHSGSSLSRFSHTQVITTPLSNYDLPEFMSRFDAYIHLGLAETFSYTPYEALATGMICIVPRDPVLTQWLPESCWGYMVEMSDLYVFDANDPGHLLMRLPDFSRLLDILDHCQEFYMDAYRRAAHGSEVVRRYFSVGRFVKTLEQCLEEACEIKLLKLSME